MSEDTLSAILFVVLGGFLGFTIGRFGALGESKPAIHLSGKVVEVLGSARLEGAEYAIVKTTKGDVLLLENRYQTETPELALGNYQVSSGWERVNFRKV